MSTSNTPPQSNQNRSPDDALQLRVAPEPALEPGLPIVDAHLHFWHRLGDAYFVQSYAEDLVASGHNVEATIYVECDSMYRATGPAHLKSVGETEFAVGMAAMGASAQYTPCRVAAGIVAYADLTLGKLARETLEAHVHAGQGRLRGIRQGAKWDPDPAVRGHIGPQRPGLYLEPEFGRGVELLTEMGLSLDASIYHPQISDVTALARAYPNASIVLIHSGSPVGHSAYADRQAETHATWLAGMRELATCSNVCVKLGGLVMSLAAFDFTTAPRPVSSQQVADLWRPYIEPCVELFGAGRCMVESNFPVDKVGLSYGTVWNMFKRIMAGCSTDEKAMVFGGTAKRVYRIG